MSNPPASQTPPEEEALYGLHPVQECLRARRRRVRDLLVDEKAAADRLRPVLRLAEKYGLPAHRTTKHELFERCGSRQHQGVVLRAEPYPYHPFSDDLFSGGPLLLLDNLEDPRNTGAILRSALLFGFRTVLLPTKGGAGVYPSVVKTSAGASEHLQIVRGANSNRYCQRAKSAGYRIVALDAKGDAALPDVPRHSDTPLLLIIGGEDKRIGQYLLRMADSVARIPQNGPVNSLNASVAAGIALYHFSPDATHG